MHAISLGVQDVAAMEDSTGGGREGFAGSAARSAGPLFHQLPLAPAPDDRPPPPDQEDDEKSSIRGISAVCLVFSSGSSLASPAVSP
jgi:hypothetical protein